MEKNATQARVEKTNLTVIKKNEIEEATAKLVAIKKIGYYPQLLLPPPQEKYIKTKKHDFL